MQIAPIRITFYFGNIVNHYSPLAGKASQAFPITEALFCSQVVVVAVVVAAVVCFCFHFNNQIKIQCNPLAAKRKRAPKLAAPTVPSSAPCHLSGLSTCCRLVFLGFSISFCERQLNSPFGPTCFNIVSSRHTFLPLLMGCFYEANISRASLRPVLARERVGGSTSMHYRIVLQLQLNST